MKKKIMLMIMCILFVGMNNVYADTSINLGNSDIAYTDSDNSGDISLGDEVKIGTEEFYVFKVDGDNVSLFTKKNVDAITQVQSSTAAKVSIPRTSYSTISSIYETIAEGYANNIKNNYNIEGTASFLTASDFKSITGVNSQVDLDLKTMSNVPSWFYEKDFLYADYTMIAGTIYAVRTIQNGVVVSEETPAEMAAKVLFTVPSSILKSATVSLDQTINGSASLSNSGNEVTITVTSEEGYELDEITAVAGSYEYTVTENKFTVDPSKGDVTVSVTFKKKMINVSIAVVEGAITDISDDTVEYGSTKKYSIKTQDGYQINSIKVNGVEMIDKLENNELTIENITEEIEIFIDAKKIEVPNNNEKSEETENPKTFDGIISSFILSIISILGLSLSLIYKKVK